ncbi:alpha/beta fold hydrolase [Kibdelosporangium phytohabitans]|uniref:alpha/beta fold hydrolase n=1 Tax=Kibdelosporangium phytohabitans TaxID=860235 RepID=UPI0007C69ABC|nr:alpha/beta hydrolase [Kibdelosporangium phytohabitans]MBE1464886.1 pimeloyl-ACP methyl ester carboxylesterase [Kibdelosporangium phytohabitans]
MHEHDVTSPDGTRIRAWRTDNAGPNVLLCPGLGTTPEAWPALLLPNAGVRVLSWYHRGTLGSQRPADESRIELADHVADALAVLDAAGVRRCVVVGWSVGVMVAAELARRHPDRVSGLMFAAGVPGDLFGAMFGLFGIPAVLRRAVALTGTHALRAMSPLVDAVVHRLPVNTFTATLIQHSGLMLPGADTQTVVRTLKRFAQHDWRWYFTLALAISSVPARELHGLTCPVTVLSGQYDVLAAPDRMAKPVAMLPQARVRVVPTSHFLPLEAPEVVVEELRLLLRRTAAVERAMQLARPPSREPIDALIPPALTYGSRLRT